MAVRPFPCEVGSKGRSKRGEERLLICLLSQPAAQKVRAVCAWRRRDHVDTPTEIITDQQNGQAIQGPHQRCATSSSCSIRQNAGGGTTPISPTLQPEGVAINPEWQYTIPGTKYPPHDKSVQAIAFLRHGMGPGVCFLQCIDDRLERFPIEPRTTRRPNSFPTVADGAR